MGISMIEWKPLKTRKFSYSNILFCIVLLVPLVWLMLVSLLTMMLRFKIICEWVMSTEYTCWNSSAQFYCSCEHRYIPVVLHIFTTSLYNEQQLHYSAIGSHPWKIFLHQTFIINNTVQNVLTEHTIRILSLVHYAHLYMFHGFHELFSFCKRNAT